MKKIDKKTFIDSFNSKSMYTNKSNSSTELKIDSKPFGPSQEAIIKISELVVEDKPKNCLNQQIILKIQTIENTIF
ncbi:MAG: hypothetical protein ACRD6U_04870 [Nitrososphaeraceae archaeon]